MHLTRAILKVLGELKPVQKLITTKVCKGPSLMFPTAQKIIYIVMLKQT